MTMEKVATIQFINRPPYPDMATAVLDARASAAVDETIEPESARTLAFYLGIFEGSFRLLAEGEEVPVGALLDDIAATYRNTPGRVHVHFLLDTLATYLIRFVTEQGDPS